jgi:hypothetical protein
MGRVSLLRPEPERPNSWARFKVNIANLISEALLILRSRTDLVTDEKELNRLLFLCIVDANRLFDLPLPAYNANNPPHVEDERKVKREDQIPDLYWSIMNHVADHSNWYRNFVLECKRLGKKTSKTWELNEQYVIGGILRFFLEEKGYGKGCETGAMVGYVQNMEFDEILSEINFSIATNESSIPKLAAPAEGWQYQGINHLSHTFQRSYIPFNFFLQHFWIDMRDCQYLALSEAENTSIESDSSLSEEIQKRGKKKSRRGSTKQRQRPPQLELPFTSL